MTQRIRAITILSPDEMAPRHPFLFGATPHGVATGQVESLVSFTCRIAERRSMRPASVISTSLQRYARQNNFDLRIQKQNCQINGAGLTAQRAADAFDSALDVSNISELTCLPWTEIIEGRMHGLLRHHIAYCPECVYHDRLVHDSCYIRLIWMLKVVESCPIHNIRLYDACVVCGGQLPVIPWLTNPLFCMTCRRDVSQDRSTYFQGRPSAFSQWISVELAKLVAATHGGGYTIQAGQLADSLRMIVEQEFNSSIAEFAHYFDLTVAAARIYVEGRGRPSFPTLCRILYQLKLSPVDLWISRNGTLSIERRSRLRRTTTEIAARRRLTAEDKSKIRKDLKRLLRSSAEIVGPAEFAKRYDTTNHVVRYHFGDLYAKHRARFHQQEKKKCAQVRAERIQRVKEAAQSLVDKGIYPSQRKLKQTGLVCASDLTRTDVRYALKRITNAFERQRRSMK